MKILKIFEISRIFTSLKILRILKILKIFMIFEDLQELENLEGLMIFKILTIIKTKTQVANLHERVLRNEAAGNSCWKLPIFNTWRKILHYEKHFPGSTSQGGVHWEM